MSCYSFPICLCSALSHAWKPLQGPAVSLGSASGLKGLHARTPDVASSHQQGVKRASKRERRSFDPLETSNLGPVGDIERTDLQVLFLCNHGVRMKRHWKACDRVNMMTTGPFCSWVCACMGAGLFLLKECDTGSPCKGVSGLSCFQVDTEA
jgi:hypothetical protein